jgi:hypothetical protein
LFYCIHLFSAGVAIGSGIGSIEDAYEAGYALHNRGVKRVSAYTLPRMLANLGMLLMILMIFSDSFLLLSVLHALDFRIWQSWCLFVLVFVIY